MNSNKKGEREYGYGYESMEERLCGGKESVTGDGSREIEREREGMG